MIPGRAKMEEKEEKQVEQRVEPNIPRKGSFRLVTDLTYYMNTLLNENLQEIPKFLKKSWDCVIVVTGTGKVRIGKSTLAMQVGYFLANLMNEERKKQGLVPQDNPVPFTNDNVAFDPDGVMKKAGKFPRNSVIVYDEGRAGLDSIRAMENINKTMQDFFNECGQYGHIIIIVLPNYFKLTETIACERSLFLLNVYTDKDYNRGYFSFFNEHKKELLYQIGRKKWGVGNKYLAVNHNFHGRFTNYFPINRELYEQQKKKAIKKKKRSLREKNWLKQRNALVYFAKKNLNLTDEKLAEEITILSKTKFTRYMIMQILKVVRGEVKEKFLEEYEDSIN